MRGAEYRYSKSDRIEDLFGGPCDWAGRVHQLAAGPLGFRARTLRLPSLRISFHGARVPVLTEEVVHTRGVVVNALIGGSRPGLYRGLEIPVGSCAVLRGGTLLDSVWPPDAHVLEVEITPPLLDQLDFSFPPHSLLTVRPEALDALVVTCEALVPPRGAELGRDVRPEQARDRVLGAIKKLMEPWNSAGLRQPVDASTQTRAYSLAMESARIMRVWQGGLRVADLSDHLGVSERSVHAAFQRSFGVGPVRFHNIMQMHRVRASVLQSDGGPGAVLAAGARVGLADPSMLSKRYRRCFGESPRATLHQMNANLERD